MVRYHLFKKLNEFYKRNNIKIEKLKSLKNIHISKKLKELNRLTLVKLNKPRKD